MHLQGRLRKSSGADKTSLWSFRFYASTKRGKNNPSLSQEEKKKQAKPAGSLRHAPYMRSGTTAHSPLETSAAMRAPLFSSCERIRIAALLSRSSPQMTEGENHCAHLLNGKCAVLISPSCIIACSAVYAMAQEKCERPTPRVSPVRMPSMNATTNQ